MLLEFTVENYRSFNEKKTLVMKADKGIKSVSDNYLLEENKYRLLNSIALYGANSSGKSNLVYAIYTMRRCVLESVKLNNNEELKFDPFLLLKDNNRPTMFEIIFLKDEYCYRYGFRYNRERIIDEWLFRKTTPRSKEKMLFVRDIEGISVDEKNFPEGIDNEEKTNDNRLFLSLCQQLGGKISSHVTSWFQFNLGIISGVNNEQSRELSRRLFYEADSYRTETLKFFQKLELGFQQIKTRVVDLNFPPDVPIEIREALQKNAQGVKRIELDSVHNVYDKDGNVVDKIDFEFDNRESAGTNKLFDISGPLFGTLHYGMVLVIDELDAKMHPILSKFVTEMFNSAETNPNKAQLIFTTHDTNLLSSKIFRRDQVWFTEKDNKEQTDLYSLVDFVFPDKSKVRNDANYEKNYIAGRYGAIPYILNE